MCRPGRWIRLARNGCTRYAASDAAGRHRSARRSAGADPGRRPLALGRWGDEDPGGGSLGSWTTGLRERSGRGSVPISWVALLDDQLVGSVALVDQDMASHPELSPWLSGLFVVPEHRGQGIGTALVRHCEAEARQLDVTRLYLHTTAEPLYAAEGWTPMFLERYGRSRVTTMMKDVAVGNRAGHAL